MSPPSSNLPVAFVQAVVVVVVERTEIDVGTKHHFLSALFCEKKVKIL
jgi:hypothetical protein